MAIFGLIFILIFCIVFLCVLVALFWSIGLARRVFSQTGSKTEDTSLLPINKFLLIGFWIFAAFYLGSSTLFVIQILRDYTVEANHQSKAFWENNINTRVVSGLHPRHDLEVVIHYRLRNQARSCSAQSFPDQDGIKGLGYLECGSPGHDSSVRWELVAYEDDADIYHFIRTTPASDPFSTSKKIRVAFNGSKQEIFQDQFQTVVIQSATREPQQHQQ